MFNQSYPQYIKSQDGVSLYTCTNFDPQKNREKVIVFNYGLVCNNVHWEKQISYFDQKGHKILIHDYRGHFNSQGINDINQVTFQSIVNDLNTICERLELTEIILFGHSMGVNIALEFAPKISPESRRSSTHFRNRLPSS